MSLLEHPFSFELKFYNWYVIKKKTFRYLYYINVYLLLINQMLYTCNKCLYFLNTPFSYLSYDCTICYGLLEFWIVYIPSLFLFVFLRSSLLLLLISLVFFHFCSFFHFNSLEHSVRHQSSSIEFSTRDGEKWKVTSAVLGNNVCRFCVENLKRQRRFFLILILSLSLKRGVTKPVRPTTNSMRNCLSRK